MNWTNRKGENLLMVYLRYTTEIKLQDLKLLLLTGIDVHTKTDLGISAYLLACANKSLTVEVIECLVEAGCDPCHKTIDGLGGLQLYLYSLGKVGSDVYGPVISCLVRK